MNMHTPPVGERLREWRQRRRLSQLAFACDAEISARHLSFLETGRARPSRDMLLHLAELLDVPFRERNALLLAAGFAPVYSEAGLDSPDAAAARRAVDLVLKGSEPYPALAVDRHWNLVAANDAAGLFLQDVDPALLEAPVNVLRLSLDPRGLAPRIENLAGWRSHIFMRLERQVAQTADPGLAALLEELKAMPGGEAADIAAEYGGLIAPVKIRTEEGTLTFFTATTVFGTAVDISFSELVIESFFPGDAFTAAAMRAAAGDA
ncbi:helix-turn-helix domain-containing protein [Parvibaculum sp.]|uniref:helix-turn-helix domain-containing protein n=1 Tax=Parvibaculum sp. TaxID=2024848 RepID=UPI001D33D2EA|nr:helix-turn-helix domain-containing protein [Parvibaculum sp.]MBX3490416.1 helix-turn-helix domain-containing protein [Parvibaculum sp.]MCW5728273.1 helix-turn-helix domain-containing protein [Parvibaculum sp.]